MRSRHWLLPALLALPLVTVLAIDVFRAAARGQLEDVALLGEGSTVQFDATDVLVDLRSGSKEPADETGGPLVTVGAGWGETTPQGRWIEGPSAELRFEVPVGGQSALFIEGRADRNHHGGTRVSVTLDGRDAGAVDLTRTMERQLLVLSPGMIRAGGNRLELRLPDSSRGAVAGGRSVLVRRLAISADDSGGLPPPRRSGLIRSVPGEGRLVIQGEGRLTLPFRVPVSGSELTFRYRFRDPLPGARCRVVVGRRYSDPQRFDLVREETLAADARAAGRFRQVLQDRGEPSALFLHVNAAAAGSGFVVEDPTIVIRPARKGGRSPGGGSRKPTAGPPAPPAPTP